MRVPFCFVFSGMIYSFLYSKSDYYIYFVLMICDQERHNLQLVVEGIILVQI